MSSSPLPICFWSRLDKTWHFSKFLSKAEVLWTFQLPSEIYVLVSFTINTSKHVNFTEQLQGIPGPRGKGKLCRLGALFWPRWQFVEPQLIILKTFGINDQAFFDHTLVEKVSSSSAITGYEQKERNSLQYFDWSFYQDCVCYITFHGKSYSQNVSLILLIQTHLLEMILFVWTWRHGYVVAYTWIFPSWAQSSFCCGMNSRVGPYWYSLFKFRVKFFSAVQGKIQHKEREIFSFSLGFSMSILQAICFTLLKTLPFSLCWYMQTCWKALN